MLPSGRCPGAGYSAPVLFLVLELGLVVESLPVPEALTDPIPLDVPVRDEYPVDDRVELVSDEQPHNPNPKLQEMIAALKRYL